MRREAEPSSSAGEVPVRPLRFIQPTESLWEGPRKGQSERPEEARREAEPSGSTGNSSSEVPVRPLRFIQPTESLWGGPYLQEKE